jgi:uncharacterized membrane protein YfcA
MGIAGFAPEVMKPTALALNILVSTIGTVLFWRAGHFSWRSFYPFGVLGFPFSLIGGALNLSDRAYYPLVGVLLMVAAVLMLRSALDPSMQAQSRDVPPPFALSLSAGAFSRSPPGGLASMAFPFLSSPKDSPRRPPSRKLEPWPG